MSKNKKNSKIKRRRYSKVQATSSYPEKTAIKFYGAVTPNDLNQLTDDDRKAMSKGTSEWLLHCAAKRYLHSKNGKSNVMPGIFARLPDGTSRPATYDDMPDEDKLTTEYLGQFAISRSKADAEKALSYINKKLKSAKISNALDTIKQMKTYKYTIESAKKVG